MNQYEYIHKTCPHCKSKRLTEVVFRRTRVIDAGDVVRDIIARHFQCDNCLRVFRYEQFKWRFDRQQVRRDMAKLQRYLDRGLPKCYRQTEDTSSKP
jgi:hypothetical protein